MRFTSVTNAFHFRKAVTNAFHFRKAVTNAVEQEVGQGKAVTNVVEQGNVPITAAKNGSDSTGSRADLHRLSQQGRDGSRAVIAAGQ